MRKMTANNRDALRETMTPRPAVWEAAGKEAGPVPEVMAISLLVERVPPPGIEPGSAL